MHLNTSDASPAPHATVKPWSVKLPDLPRWSVDEALDRAEAKGLVPRPSQRDGEHEMICPLHDDHEPSLTLRVGEAGTLMWYCFPCQSSPGAKGQEDWVRRLFRALGDGDPGAIVTATTRVTRERRRRDILGPVEHAYIYAEDGVPVARKCRYTVTDAETAKTRRAFVWQRWDASQQLWHNGLDRPMADLPLYRVDDLRRARAAGVTEVAVTEGESDAEAIEAQDMVAVCAPNGSGPWSPQWTKELWGFTHVRIFADDDPAGRASAEDKRRALSTVVTRVTVWQAPYANDVRAHLESGRTLAELVEVPARQADAVVRSPRLAQLRTGDWLQQQHFDPLRYALPGVIPEGLVLLVGRPKIGKSWFVLGLGLAVATGATMLAQSTGDPRPVLYLALEDGDRRMKARCDTLLGGVPIPANLHYLTRIEPGQVAATVSDWLAGYAAESPLVVVDTLAKVVPNAVRGETDYQRDYRIASELKSVVDDYKGATMLVNHHDRKAAADDFVDTVSGTHGLAGAADAIIVVVRSRTESAGVLKVTGRDIAENEYAVAFSGSTWTLCGESLAVAATTAQAGRATAHLGDQATDVFEFVSARPAGVKAADVAHGLEIDQKQAADQLGRLCRSGRLDRIGRGEYVVKDQFDTGDTSGTVPEPGWLMQKTTVESVASVESANVVSTQAHESRSMTQRGHPSVQAWRNGPPTGPQLAEHAVSTPVADPLPAMSESTPEQEACSVCGDMKDLTWHEGFGWRCDEHSPSNRGEDL